MASRIIGAIGPLRDRCVPFCGTTQSGVGREGGEEAPRFFIEPKSDCLRLPCAP
jgi:aminomuconate-semialdehyde/2-hydroxymuconate-6-semialdehyde dehydrogenase